VEPHVPVRRQNVGKIRHRQHEIEPFRAGRSQLPTGITEIRDGAGQGVHGALAHAADGDPPP
jgi:hypothetical protein